MINTKDVIQWESYGVDLSRRTPCSLLPFLVRGWSWQVNALVNVLLGAYCTNFGHYFSSFFGRGP